MCKNYVFIALTLLVACDCIQNAKGTVIDSVTKKPIIDVDAYNKNKSWNKTETDEKGHFELSNISGGLICSPMSIIIQHKDYTKVEIEIKAGGQRDILLVKNTQNGYR